MQNARFKVSKRNQFISCHNHYLMLFLLVLFCSIGCSNAEHRSTKDDPKVIEENKILQGVPFRDSTSFNVLILPLASTKDSINLENKFETDLLKRLHSIVKNRSINANIRFDTSFGFPAGQEEATRIGKNYNADLILWNLKNTNEQKTFPDKVRYQLLHLTFDSVSLVSMNPSNLKMIKSLEKFEKGMIKNDLPYLKNWITAISGYYTTDFNLAFEFFSKLRIPKCENATNYHFADVARDLNKQLKSISLYSQIIDCDKLDLLNRYNLGQMFTMEERYEEAIAEYDKILNLDKMNHDARRNRAWNNIILDKYKEAKEDLHIIESTGNMGYDAYQLLGFTYKDNEPLLALKYFKKSFEMEATDYVCLYILECYETLKNKKGLEKYLIAADSLDITKNDIEYYKSVLEGL